MSRFLTCVILSIVITSLAGAQQKRAGSRPTKKLNLVECFGYNWPDEEVPYIITPEEATAFRQLSNDVERNNFIEQFWVHRDPTPDTYPNEFKDEYYRRILDGNQQFSTKQSPGWRSDRGRIYLKYGAPDSIETISQNGVPTILWNYRWLDDLQSVKGSQEAIQLKFVDSCRCGEFLLSATPEERKTLFSPVPLPETFHPTGSGIQLFVGVQRAPAVRFRDLEEFVTHRVAYHLVPYDVELSFLPVTRETVQVSVKLAFPNSKLKWVEGTNEPEAHVQLYARWTTLTQRVALIAEDDFNFTRTTEDQAASLIRTMRAYLSGRRYRLDLVVRDVNADMVGTWSQGVVVPVAEWCSTHASKEKKP